MSGKVAASGLSKGTSDASSQLASDAAKDPFMIHLDVSLVLSLLFEVVASVLVIYQVMNNPFFIDSFEFFLDHYNVTTVSLGSYRAGMISLCCIHLLLVLAMIAAYFVLSEATRIERFKLPLFGALVLSQVIDLFIDSVALVLVSWKLAFVYDNRLFGKAGFLDWVALNFVTLSMALYSSVLMLIKYVFLPAAVEIATRVKGHYEAIRSYSSGKLNWMV